MKELQNQQKTSPPHQRLKHRLSKVEDVVADGIVVLQSEWRQNDSIAHRECQPHAVRRFLLQHRRRRHSNTTRAELPVQHHRLHISSCAARRRPVRRWNAGKGCIRWWNAGRRRICRRNSLHRAVRWRNSPRRHSRWYFRGIAGHHRRQLLSTSVQLVLQNEIKIHIMQTNITFP